MLERIALLHPGDMGVTVGSCASAAGHWVGWSAEGRSETTRIRARAAGFETCGTLKELIAKVDIVLSVCPPAAAEATAEAVARLGFRGLYVDANAVSPRTAELVAHIVQSAGGTYVDGGIIGPPVHGPGTTRLYLSGGRAAAVAECFAGSDLEAIDIGAVPGAASALKMCYAAWTKGSAALLIAVGALACAEGVEAPLRAEWECSLPGLADQLNSTAVRNAPKAWRFVGEMHEIADTFEANGLTGGFHRAAAESFAQLAGYKDAASVPGLDEVLQTMLARGATSHAAEK